MNFNLENNGYRKEQGVYVTSGTASHFPYSDGEEVEALLLESIRLSKDISIGSEELQNQIKNWPTLYHLSPKRANILRPFADQLRNKKILEIGSGCGAITRFLGELGCQVLSLEGSLQRAKITAERCRDLENITVINDNFKDFSCNEKFDFVILVGVLEYANLFMDGPGDRSSGMLDKIKNNLNLDGNVIIAIENKIGLKYWAGAPEDHNGKVYYGTQNLYSNEDVTTFGHNEISNLLSHAGFSISEFLYPYPDYKLPEVIISADGFKKQGFAAMEMLLEKFDYFQNAEYNSQFSSTLSGYALSDNQLLPHFANSFLILATVSQIPPPQKELQLLANVYTVGRKKKYCKQAGFLSHVDSNEIFVTKQLLYDNQNEDSGYVRHEVADEVYIKGRVLFGTILPIVSANGWTTSDIIDWARIYYDILISRSFRKDNQTWLTGNYADLTPFNVILSGNEAEIFDQEWTASEDLPAYYVFFRGLVHSLGKILFVNIPERDTLLQVTRLASEVTKYYFQFDNAELNDCKSREIKYFSNIALNKTAEPFPAHELRVRNSEYYKLVESRKELLSEIEDRSKIIQELENKNAGKETTIQTLQHQLDEAKENTERLLQSYSTVENTLAEKNIVVTSQNQTINFLKAKIEEYSKSIQTLEGKNSDKDIIVQKQKEKEHSLYIQLDALGRRLNEIYESDGWKLLSKYYNLKGKLLHEDSKRYKFLKKTINLLRGKKESFPTVNHSTVPDSASGLQTVTGNDSRQMVFDVLSFPSFENPVVSIIIPVFNGWEVTYRCLKSIHTNTIATSYEIIVADDGATDETKNIDRYIKNITVILNEKNLGFLHNCNNAAEKAKGKYILFLNNDTEVKPAWLSHLADLMEKDEKIGMTGSKLIYPDGRLQEAGGILWKDGSAWNFGHSQSPDAPEFNYVKEVDYISGACILIRSALWKEIGGFDTRYAPAYCEDSDLAFEVRKKGYKVVYQPLSEVIHYEGYSHGVEGQTGSIKEYQTINNRKLKEKWNDILQKEHFPNGENVFWARDRSRSKKTIVVVDHYIPHYDKDAGSRTVFQYLNLFTSMDLNVKFIGDNFYRHEPYTTTLQQMGVEVLYGPWYAENWKQWVKDNHDKFDYILLNRPHIAIKYIDFVKENTNAKILYYGHDLHFVREMKQYEIEKNPVLLESSEKWKKTETYIFRKADIVLAPSIEESNEIKALGVNTVKSIKPYIFNDTPFPINHFSHRKNILFIGGFSHVPNVDAVIWFVKEVWPLIKKQIPPLKFIIAGSNPPAAITALANGSINVLGFISDEELQKLYAEIKVVVIPLRYGAGVKGKTVEALFNGIPLVSTKFGIEGLPGDISFLLSKDQPEDFAKEVIRVYNLSDKELAAISKTEVNYITSNFTFEIVRSDIMNIFQGLT